ncbi:MAG: hypothetical protein WCO60_16775 [Verrucomicrobiota bacterium]
MFNSRLPGLSVALGLGFLGATCIGAFAAKGEVRVESIGSGDTRDTALVDACRLAVAKVHGTRVLGRMSMKDSSGTVSNSSGTKTVDDYKFNSDTTTFAVRDNTTLSFQGLLLRFEIKREKKQQERWEVEIGADVLDHMPDRFAGKQAVVLPSVARIEKALAKGVLNGAEPGPIARDLRTEITRVFANHPQFVILERGEGEALVNEELNRASGTNSAIKEQAKLQSEKVADIVVEIEVEPLLVNVENIRFENAPNLFKTEMRLAGFVRLIDVPSKGEICRVPFAVKTKPFPAAGSAQASVKGASDSFRAALGQSLRLTRAELLSQLGVSNLIALPDGRLQLIGGVDLIQPGDTLTLWSKNTPTPTKLGESPVQLEGSFIKLSNPELRVRTGEVFTYKVTTTEVLTETNSVSPSSTPAPNKPSLKDRIGF